MDPNANLEEQRKLAAAFIEARDKNQDVDLDDVDRLAELIQALDQWISRGGFLPNDWAAGRRKG